jgi:hypothetical protein
VSHSHFGLQLVAPLAIFGGVPGDSLIVRVGHADPICLVRSLPPNFGAVCDALANALVFPVSPSYDASSVIETLRALEEPYPAAAPVLSGRHRRSPRLHVLR